MSVSAPTSPLWLRSHWPSYLLILSSSCPSQKCSFPPDSPAPSHSSHSPTPHSSRLYTLNCHMVYMGIAIVCSLSVFVNIYYTNKTQMLEHQHFFCISRSQNRQFTAVYLVSWCMWIMAIVEPSIEMVVMAPLQPPLITEVLGEKEKVLK